MKLSAPVFRKLRVFALDPSTAAELDSAGINEVTLSVPWEDHLLPGPAGEYIEVVDEDKAGRELCPPVNLNQAATLVRSGLDPSDGDCHFHQQMVYAVSMITISTFEGALGRRMEFWRPDCGPQMEKLRLYPHYEQVKNAHPLHGNVISFGYAPADATSPSSNTNIFTCLSQDIIAHELGHALLATCLPLRRDEPDNPDRMAFQEGFCDLLAVLQRCTQPEFVRPQLVRTRGDIAAASQLGVMAPQLGQSFGSKTGLFSAFGDYDADGVWQVRTPNRGDYVKMRQPQKAAALRSILFAAVFRSLNQIYHSRVDDLLGIASEGRCIRLSGELHPDLVDRLTEEFVKSARHVLRMCIRAADYLPSVGITFGDYLRAIITADYDLSPTDSRGYRLAFVDAFRSFGIVPAGLGTLSVDTLLWPKVTPGSSQAKVVDKFIAEVCDKHTAWSLPHDRKLLHAHAAEWCQELKHYFDSGKLDASLLSGIDPHVPFDVASVQVSARAVRPGPTRSYWSIEILQDIGPRTTSCRLLVDADTREVVYEIAKTVDACGPLPAPPPDIWRYTEVGLPQTRPLRVFSFDPSMAAQLETVPISQVTLKVPWEKLAPGPIGEYLEVIDYDPASGVCYEPANLNHKYLLAEWGYAPSQAVPQFHQQMVYAVAMRTIGNFEYALGRLALWSPRTTEGGGPSTDADGGGEFVQRLRLYPHALREANAFYSPSKKAVLFGYFQSSVESAANPVTVFTCLSQDIIAHELTHALLDGMHRLFTEPSNPDVLAFHEAFADIVALFQHFSLPEVLEHQIANSRGDLASQNRLGELAQELGSAIGKRGALRSAIGEIDAKTGEWVPHKLDPGAYGRELEPHTRGSLLVAAVFDAFLTIYKARVADLLRIASSGTGVLPAGQLHPDLVRRLAAEAADSAQDVLDACIRALDLCPPVDLTFGDYLRAIVTADREFDPADERHHRVAFVEAFRRHGILPTDVRTFALEALYWPNDQPLPAAATEMVRDHIQDWTSKIPSWNLTQDRRKLHDLMAGMRCDLQVFLNRPEIKRNLEFALPDLDVSVHTIRPSMRTDLLGRQHFMWIVEVIQSQPDSFAADIGAYTFYGGTTLVVDVDNQSILYSINKSMHDEARRTRQREYRVQAASESLSATYFQHGGAQEPFAAVHRI